MPKSFASNGRRKAATGSMALPPDPSFLEQVKSTGLSALEGLGNFLDTPGSMVRDTLSGENPFDNLLHPFSSTGRTSGRDLLTKWGITSQNKETGFAYDDPSELGQDILGFGAELVTDPLAWATGLLKGGLSKAGEITKSAGALDDLHKVAGLTTGRRAALAGTTIGDVLEKMPQHAEAIGRAAKGAGYDSLEALKDMPLGGTIGISHPLGTKAMTILNSDKINTLLDAVGGAVRGAPGIKQAYQAFGAARKGTASVIGQHVAENVSRAQAINDAETHMKILGHVNDLSAAKYFDKFPSVHEASDDAYRVLEGFQKADPEHAHIFDDISNTYRELQKRHEELGIKSTTLKDEFIKEYAARLGMGKKGGERAKGGRIFSATDPNYMEREAILKDIPGGTADLNKMARESAAAAKVEDAAGNVMDKKAFGQWFEQKYGNTIPDTYKIRKDGVEEVVEGRRARLASYIHEAATAGHLDDGLFADPFTAAVRRNRIGRDRASVAEAFIDAVTDDKVYDRALKESGGQTVPLKDVVTQMGFNTDTSTETSIFDALAKRAGRDPKELADASLPKSLADDLIKVAKPFQGPDPMGWLGEKIDWATNLTKAGQTGIWPGFHVRNFVSGQVRNYLTGMGSRKSIADAHGLLSGKVVKGAKNIPFIQKVVTERGLPMTDEAATQVLRETVQSYRMSGRWQGQFAAHVDDANVNVMRETLPGVNAENPLLAYAKGFMPGQGNSANPLNVKEFGPYKGGRQLGEFVEGMNRTAPFIDQLRKGVDPSEAAKQVLKAHVDYSSRAFSPIENTVMKRLFPYYSFQSRQIPHVVGELANHPGGPTAAGLMALASGHSKNDVIPEDVSATASIPLGQIDDQGTKRYLTGLGLMEEAPLNYLQPSTAGVTRNLMANLNPLVKWIPEQASQQAFFQQGPDQGGRPLKDLDPTIGRLISNVMGYEDPVQTPRGLEYLAGMSPAGRLLYTARTLTDPRKGVLTKATNLGTGLRVTDVSKKRQDAVLRNLTEELMKESGGKTFNQAYYPKGMELSQEQRMLLGLDKQLTPPRKKKAKA